MNIKIQFYLDLLKKIFSVSDKNEKKSFILLCFFLIINSLLEILSIGSIIPILGLLLDDKKFLTFYNIFSEQFIEELIICSFLFLILFKNLLYSLILKFQYSYIFSIKKKITNNLFYNYLSLPYLTFSKKTKGVILRNLNQEIDCFITGLNSLVNIITDVFIIIAISIFILIYNFKLNIFILLIFVLLSFIFNKYIGIINSNLGIQRQKIEGVKNSFFIESINNFLAIKILDNIRKFFYRFVLINNKSMSLLIKQNFLNALSKVFYEIISAFLITGCLLYFFFYDYTNSYIITNLSLILIGIIRLTPSFNKISSNHQTIKFLSHSINLIHKEIIDNYRINTKKIFKNKFQNLFFEEIDFNYKDKKIISGMNMQIFDKQHIAIIGKSGSGKSTLLNLMCGLLDPQSGKIMINNEDLINYNIMQKLISYTPQEPLLFNFSLNFNLFLEEKKNINYKTINLLKDLEIWDIVSQYKINDHNFEKVLSGGQKKRLCIARGLLKNASIYIFDEPTNGLDDLTKKSVMNTILKYTKNKTLIIVSHDLSIVHNFQYKYEFKNKKLIIV